MADLAERTGGVIVCDKLLNIRAGEKQVLVATIYKHMNLKPNVLQ